MSTRKKERKKERKTDRRRREGGALSYQESNQIFAEHHLILCMAESSSGRGEASSGQCLLILAYISL